jgi:hypothetical protein
MADDVVNVFISHRHADDAKVGKLKELLAKHGCLARDSSITKDSPNRAKDPDYIMNSILKPAIDWASTLIVIVSPKTHEHDWVNREIEYANSQDKTIVGVWAPGAADSDLPEMLDKYADAVVGWQGEKILDAIDGKTNVAETAAGAVRADRAIVRHNC